MKLTWTRLALQDLQHLYEYIAEDNTVAARVMISRIREVAENLKKHPQLGKAGRVEKTRELVIVQSPYILVYTVMGNQLTVIAVIHSAQRWPDTFPEV